MSKTIRSNRKENNISIEAKNCVKNKLIKKWNKFENKMMIIGLIIIILKIREYSLSQINDNFPNITLKIKGKGFCNIYFNQGSAAYSSNNYAKKVKINGVEKTATNNNYDFEEEINTVELFWENNDINTCKNMFRGNSRLIEIDLNNFDIRHVKSMWCMFKECTGLSSLNATKLDTSNIEQMNGLFHKCSSLTSLDLSNFNTLKVTAIDNIFSGCTNLEYINIQNFKDNNYNTINNFFDNLPVNAVFCVNKENIKKIIDQLQAITFYTIDCSDVWRPNQKKLIENSNTCVDKCSNTDYKYEFYGKCYKNCENNINGKTINVCHYYFDYNDNTFKECYQMCKTCKEPGNINDNNCDECNFGYSFLNDPFLKSKNCYINCKLYYINENNEYNCVNSCPQNYNKLIEQRKKCIDKCIKDSIYIYDYNDTCLEECPPNTKVDEEEKKCYDSCPEYKFEYNNNCLSDCPSNTYRFFTYRNICLESLNESYYLDEIDKIYKLCYENCKKCYGKGDELNNNCIECKNGFILLNEPNKINNCFKCNFNYYIDESNKFHCTEDYNCISNHKNYILEKNKCINLCQNDNIYKLEYEGLCVKNCPNGTFASNNNICHNNNATISQFLNQESNSFTNAVLTGAVNFNNLTENNTVVMKKLSDGVTMCAGTTDTLKNNFNSEVSSIDLGTCEDEIKEYYNISLNQSLIIVKSDVKTNYSLIPKVGYQLIDPNTLSILNLSHCKTNEAKLYFPVVIDTSSLDLFNPSSDFYNDNCYTYTTENGTDILLKDRQQEFMNKNLSLCDNNCIFMEYDEINKQSICACEIQNKAETISDIMNNPNQIPKEFVSNEESKSSSNMMSIKCLSLSGLKNNISSYILLLICLYFLFSIVFFIKCGFRMLKKKIDQILRAKEKEIIIMTDNQMNQGKNNIFNGGCCGVRKKINKHFPPKRLEIKFIENDNPHKRYHRVQRSDFNSAKSFYKLNLFNEIIKKNEVNDKNKENKIKPSNKNISFKDVKKKDNTKNIFFKSNFYDYELNTMSYQEAIIFDKRSCCGYYISLIKIKHPFYFGFCCINDYNLFIIKSSMFFLSFAICFAVNFFFFNEDMIHKIYELGGKYDILFFIPKISISFSIYHILTIIIKFIFLSERNLLEIKKQKTLISATGKSYRVLSCLRIKYIFYFLLGLIFIGIFWLFLSSFSAVYQNTQIILLKNTLICFSISFIYPFFINIFPCLFRICSLSGKNLKCLYNISLLFQLI